MNDREILRSAAKLRRLAEKHELTALLLTQKARRIEAKELRDKTVPCGEVDEVGRRITSGY